MEQWQFVINGKSSFDVSYSIESSNANVWPVQTIYSDSSIKREGLAAADINLDGKLEIVGGGLWFEHIGDTILCRMLLTTV